MEKGKCLHKLYHASEFRKVYIPLSGKETVIKMPVEIRSQSSTLSFLLFDCNNAVLDVLGSDSIAS